ncbi:MAG: GNAT family N-acetyltransferase, partial [Alphaproteobacteria bacterium]|nr:GNAT family N-acetyltransferase [Alphaproteobacteria bacterium]
MSRIASIPRGGNEALAALHRLCFPDDPWEAGALARVLGLAGGFGWLAWEQEEPAGFILIRDLGNECEVLSLGVAPRWRRRGIARELLATAIGEAGQRALPTLVLEVAVDNEPASNLYAATGFVAV